MLASMINPKRSIAAISIIITLFLITIAGNENSNSREPRKGSEQYFYFYYDNSDDRMTLKALPLIFRGSTTAATILDSLFKCLSSGYFSRRIENAPSGTIALKLLKIDSIKTSNRINRVASISIIDTNKICMSYFFQGSSGAHGTYLMLVANLLQPQCRPPFLDGIIILYNGTPLAPLDHMNIDGIFVPATFSAKAEEAIARSR